jgi:sugar/nucleoside kinase (ribokinase family)
LVFHRLLARRDRAAWLPVHLATGARSWYQFKTGPAWRRLALPPPVCLTVFPMSLPLNLTGVLCAGNISHDILVRPVDEFRWGTNTWVEEYVEDMGGNGSNTSFALGTLGVPVRLLGMVGRDERGDSLLAKLDSAGVDTRRVGRSRQPTTTTICVTNSHGDRLFFQRVGASLEAFAEPVDFTPDLCAGMSHYHQANLYSLPNLRHNPAEPMRRARQAGLTVSVDTGWAADGRWMEVLAPVLPFTDLLFVNEDEACMLTGSREPATIAATLRRHGATHIVLKLGGRGSILFHDEGAIHAPAFQVPVVDTTGAGDCFAAGFLAALHRGKSPAEALRFANAVGAFAVTTLGAVRGIRPWADIEAWAATAPLAAPL